MSGELLLKTKSGALPALALSCLLTAGLALVFLRYLPLQSGRRRRCWPMCCSGCCIRL